MRLFEHLLSPVSIESFFNQYFDQDILHISGRSSQHYDEIFSLTQLEQIIRCNGSALHHSLKVVKSTIPGVSSNPISQNSSPRTIPDPESTNLAASIRSLHQDGYTIVFSKIHAHAPQLAEIVHTVSLLLNCAVSINAYVTPPHAQGFGPHFDTHDTMILQISGEKLWRLHGKEADLPTTHDIPYPLEQDCGFDRKYTEERLLKPGDLMYLPRGFSHEAMTGSDSSLHLTIGFYSYTWFEFISDLAKQASNEDRRFRRRLPIGLGFSDHDHSTIHCEIADLLKTLSEPDIISRAIVQHQQRLNQSVPVLVPIFESGRDICSLSGNTTVRRVADCLVSRTSTEAVISFPGSTVSGPLFLAEVFAYISSTTTPFVIDSLPDLLNAESKIILVKKLLDEGLLVTVN